VPLKTSQRSDSDSPSLSEFESFVRDWRDSREALNKYIDASGLEHDYCFKLKQFKETDDPLKRKRRKTVASLDIYDIVRYQSATAGAASTYLDVQPDGPAGDESATTRWTESAATMKAALMSQISDVGLGFPRVKRRVIRMALGARAGAARLDVVPGGPTGNMVVPKEIDWRNLQWDLRYLHFNDWGCPWMSETMRVPLSWAKAQGWKGTDQLHPDDGERGYESEADPKVDRSAWERHRNHVTLVYRWILDMDEAPEPDPPVELDPRNWFMACSTCGYSEHDLSKQDDYDGSALLEFDACPQCGMTEDGLPVAQMERMEVEPPKGKEADPQEKHRLVIFAPFSANAGKGEKGLLYDKPWPRGLEGYPYWMFVPDPFPLEPVGNSTTFLNQDMQSLKNESLRSARESMDSNHDFTVFIEDQFTDGRGEPYQFDGSGPTGYTAFTTNPETLRSGIYHHKGSGLPSDIMPWLTVLDANLTRYKGTGQFSMSPAQMKGTTATTVARVQETGDVPQDEVGRILREDLEQFFQRWLELMAGNWTIDQWVKVAGVNGTEVWRLLRPSALPRLRLHVHAGPNLNVADLEKIDKLKSLIGAPPAAMRFIGREANLPSELVEQLIKETAQPAGSPGVGIPSGLPGAAPPMLPPAMVAGGA
jgi:hypothetical protein